ncbi:hypothetical protein F511_23701 [Dorcoceras hygrometricum]|uniref:DUF1308 domain-containing protein n=1 Tax=Dorcoceras hygrometricum TaxID=472368 RepID=A0A2Z7BH73_9LAMI|nr:hypothetical protein F511_23701 [Dorcoceras hygrometricum]
MESPGTAAFTVEDVMRRLVALSDRIIRAKIRPNDTLLRLINSELSFLRRISASTPTSSPRSFNVGHLEAVVHVLQQPSITGISRVCKSIPLSPSQSIYVDIVCSMNGNPVWFVVSDRNPRYLSWDGGPSDKHKGLKFKIEQVVDAASQAPVSLRPSSVVLFFSNGIDESICQKIKKEYASIDLEMDQFSYEEHELEHEWTNVVLGRSFSQARVIQIKVGLNRHETDEKNLSNTSRLDKLISCNRIDEFSDLSLGKSFSSLISGMKCWCCSLDYDTTPEIGLSKISLGEVSTKLVNLDTTAMIAIVSGISNGGTDRLLATSKSELIGRFKGNYEFVIAQANSEIQSPVISELSAVISGKRGIICQSVYSEFQELISMYGGPNEKLRAKCLQKLLKVVPDCPSTRLASLKTTRKLALKNKVVFGTGDYWYALTLTANMAFVRAVSQTGMSLYVSEHRPRALIGD